MEWVEPGDLWLDPLADWAYFPALQSCVAFSRPASVPPLRLVATDPE